MMSDVLTIEEVTDEQVIVKVNAKDALTVARHPYLSSDMAYITITRGKNHIFTVIKENGTTWDFHFGESGYTLVSDGITKLKQKVLSFLDDNRIPIDYDGGTLTGATIYYNSGYKKWQLAIDTSKGRFMVWSSKATDFTSAVEEFKPYVEAHWNQSTAVTGITVWKAVNPKFNVR